MEHSPTALGSKHGQGVAKAYALVPRGAFLRICLWSDTSIDCVLRADFSCANRYDRYGRLLKVDFRSQPAAFQGPA